jgi:hypothetical protein
VELEFQQAVQDKGKQKAMGRVKAKASLWKLQQKTLEAAGLWAFIKDSNQFPHPDQQIVVSFIKTMDIAASLTCMVNLKTTHIKNHVDGWRFQELRMLQVRLVTPTDHGEKFFKMGLQPRTERCGIWKRL